jgi:hypothetical protein
VKGVTHARLWYGELPWTWEQIERDWLPGGGLARSADEVVESFNRVEAAFGREWIERSRMHSGAPVSGTSPTLQIVSLGERLASLDGLPGADPLVAKLRAGRADAAAEATAIYLLRSGDPLVEIELEPVVTVSERERRPDFRARRAHAGWTYVEVAKPDMSQVQAKAQEVLTALTDLMHETGGHYGLEIFLRREPSGEEVEYLKGMMPRFVGREGTAIEELPNDLGKLFLNESPPGQVVLAEREGEEDQPRLGVAQVYGELGVPLRHIAVRMAFADERADDFLRTEARQLPVDAPGLVMLQTSGAAGAWRKWEPILRRRLQPTMHTRVSAVCLFQGGQVLTERGETIRRETKLIVNPYAALPIPDWFSTTLSQFEPDLA